MYVCVCNAITDSNIREAYADGTHTFDALQDELGVSTCCGCCEPMVRDILAACQAEEPAQAVPVAMPVVRWAVPQPG